jgi:hypothetical protein
MALPPLLARPVAGHPAKCLLNTQAFCPAPWCHRSGVGPGFLQPTRRIRIMNNVFALPSIGRMSDMSNTRPPVDVIIPFLGSPEDFRALADRISRLQLGAEDAVIVVDNTRSSIVEKRQRPSFIRVAFAPERQSSYHARNTGAVAGRNSWLVFLDADVEPVPNLLDLYLSPPPQAHTGVLCGSVRDVRGMDNERESLASRYSRLRRLIDQENTLKMNRPYAKTANCVVRRAAFEHVGGFIGDIRSGGDADLCFRLFDAGWKMELRSDAVAEHRGRRTVLQLLGQRARHGSGAEWLEARYPGFVGPRLRMSVLARRTVTGTAAACRALVRRDRDTALIRLLDPFSNFAFDVGRRIPNSPWRDQLGGLLQHGRWQGSGEARTSPTRR